MRFVRRGGGPAQPATPLGSSYMLHQLLGRGGMGQVWLGSIRATGEAVAVKVLNPEYGSDPEVVSRFLQERSILMGLHSPHLVGVRDLVAEGETLAIVMDLVQGGDLRRYLTTAGPSLAPAFAAGLTAQVLTGLAAVHASGIVHRDLKPENVLLDKGGGDELPVCRLSDFGIARLTTGPGLTKTTGLIGTPEYMAPELADQESPGPAADLYAAGIMLYELVAGRTPFAGGPAVAVLRRHIDEAPARPDGVPDPLWELIAELLAKRPDLRPSATESAERLVAMIPALLAAASPGEGAEGPDPNVTLLPGYQATRSPGEAVGTGRLRVPLPLAADRPRGNELVTLLPGRASSGGPAPATLPAAFRGGATTSLPQSRRTMAIVAAVIAGLLVTVLGVGLLVRSGSGGGDGQASSSSTLPASGRLGGGQYDTSFVESNPLYPFVSDSRGLTVKTLRNPAIAKDGHGSYLQMLSATNGGVVLRTIQVSGLSVDRRYEVGLYLRSETGPEVLGHIYLLSGTGQQLSDRDLSTAQGGKKPFCVYQGWTHLVTSPFPGSPQVHALTVLIEYTTKGSAVPVDMTQVEYTFGSGPPTADPQATPTPMCT